jgi:hypothetical protein
MIREDRYRLVHPRWSIAENGEWRLESGNTGTTHPPQGSQG